MGFSGQAGQARMWLVVGLAWLHFIASLWRYAISPSVLQIVRGTVALLFESSFSSQTQQPSGSDPALLPAQQRQQRKQKGRPSCSRARPGRRPPCAPWVGLHGDVNKTVGTRSEPTRIGMRLRKAVRKLLRQVHGTTSAPVVFRDAEVMRLIPMQRRGTTLAGAVGGGL